MKIVRTSSVEHKLAFHVSVDRAELERVVGELAALAPSERRTLFRFSGTLEVDLTDEAADVVGLRFAVSVRRPR